MTNRIISRAYARGLAGALVMAILGTLVAPPVWAAGAQSQVVGRHRAFIVSASGTVEVKVVGQANWTAAAANREVRTGDKIRTGAASRARLKVGDVGEFDIASSSEVTVGNLQQVRTTARAFFMLQRTITRDDVAMDLRNGDMRSSFHRTQGRVGNYNVYSPVAVAGVRGTRFEMDLEGGRPWYEEGLSEPGKGDGDEMGLMLTCSDGEVGLAGPNWERTVRSGEQLYARQGQTPGQAGPADRNKLDELEGTFTKSDTTATDGTDTSATGSSTDTSSSATMDGNDDSYDTNAVLADLTQQLFDAYTDKNPNDFLALVDHGFSGVNNSGNALTYSTLQTSLQGDMRILSSVAFDPTVTSIQNLDAQHYRVNVTWNGRFQFATVDTELVRSGMTTTMIWGGARPFLLQSWEGAAPFGLTVPSTDIASAPVEDGTDTPEVIPPTVPNLPVVLPPPVVTSFSGVVTDRVITGPYQDFAPYRITINGSDFQPGARVETFENGAWQDPSMGMKFFTAATYYQNETLLYLDVSQDIEQYFPGEPLTDIEEFRVINPDGQASDPQLVTFTTTPGPLSLVSVTPDRPVQSTPDATPYSFTVTGYNFVEPLTVNVSAYSGGGALVAMGPDFTVVPNSVHLMTNMGGQPTMGGSTQPIPLTFQATVVANLSSSPYYVNVCDARGPVASIDFPITMSTSMTWSTPQTLANDFPVPAGQTLTINNGVSVTGPGRIIVDGTLNANGATLTGVSVSVGATGNAALTNCSLSGGSTFPAVDVAGGNLTISGGSLTSATGVGVNVQSGLVSLSGVTISGCGGPGVDVLGGQASLTNCPVSGNATGLHQAGGIASVSGGSLSNNTNDGVKLDGGSFTQSGATAIANNGVNGVTVNGPVSVSLGGATITGSTSGIVISSSAGNAPVQLSNVSISGASGPAILADGGAISLNGNNPIDGGSFSAISLQGSASLATSGTGNNLSSTGGSSVIQYSSGAFGTLSLNSGTTITGGIKGLELLGGGSVGIGSGVTVQNAQGAGIFVGSGNVTMGAATIQNNGGEGVSVDGSVATLRITGAANITNNGASFGAVGVLVGSCSLVDINGANITNNASFGVARTSLTLLPGVVSLTNVQLAGNNGQPGSDMNTSPSVPNSSQYNYMINPPNSVSSPR